MDRGKSQFCTLLPPHNVISLPLNHSYILIRPPTPFPGLVSLLSSLSFSLSVSFRWRWICDINQTPLLLLLPPPPSSPTPLILFLFFSFFLPLRLAQELQ